MESQFSKKKLEKIAEFSKKIIKKMFDSTTLITEGNFKGFQVKLTNLERRLGEFKQGKVEKLVSEVAKITEEGRKNSQKIGDLEKENLEIGQEKESEIKKWKEINQKLKNELQLEGENAKDVENMAAMAKEQLENMKKKFDLLESKVSEDKK